MKGFLPQLFEVACPPQALAKSLGFFCNDDKDAPAKEAQRENTLQQVSAGFFQVLASLYFDWEVVYGLYMLPFPLQTGWVSPLGPSNQHKRQRNTRNTTEIGNKQCKSNLGLKL